MAPGVSIPDTTAPPRRKVLVIDDSSTIRRTAEIFLSQAGYQVVLAEDGFEALAKVGELHPDLVFCDILMPRLDGYQTCSLIKKSPRFQCHAGRQLVICRLAGCQPLAQVGGRQVDGERLVDPHPAGGRALYQVRVSLAFGQCRQHRTLQCRQLKTRPRGGAQVHMFEQGLPAVPGVQAQQLVGAISQHSEASGPYSARSWRTVSMV